MTRIVPRVPVVPGKDGARRPKADCAACGTTLTPVLLLPEVVDDQQIWVCVDYRVCAQNYRLGMSPAGFQRYLQAHEAVLVPAR